MEWGLVALFILSISALIIALVALFKKAEVPPREPTFCCGRCGCMGEFYEPWELCEPCVKKVYGPYFAQSST